MNHPNSETISNERYMNKHIPYKIIQQELELFGVKSDKYIQLHPTEATHEFFETYKLYLRDHIRKTRDVDEGDANAGYLGKSIHTLGTISARQIWEARQCADLFGIDYGFYISEYFKVSRDWNFGRDLKPKDLAFGKVVVHIHDRWKQYNHIG